MEIAEIFGRIREMPDYKKAYRYWKTSDMEGAIRMLRKVAGKQSS